MKMKTCTKCGLEKPATEEFYQFRTDTNRFRSYCVECQRAQKKAFYNENREHCLAQKKESAERHKDKRKAYKQQYYQEHKQEVDAKNAEYARTHKAEKREYDKQYREENKERIAANKKEYVKVNRDKVRERRNEWDRKKNEDPAFRFRKNVSKAILRILIENGSTKNGESIVDHLEWTLETCLDHIQSLFSAPYNLTSDGKVWMSMENYGPYNVSKWKDEDPTTWRWNLDHILPQSDYPYDSMKHSNFKIVWALSNLRPFSAKQNMIDGASKVRHKKAYQSIAA